MLGVKTEAIFQYGYLSLLVSLWTHETSSVAAQVLFQSSSSRLTKFRPNARMWTWSSHFTKDTSDLTYGNFSQQIAHNATPQDRRRSRTAREKTNLASLPGFHLGGKDEFIQRNCVMCLSIYLLYRGVCCKVASSQHAWAIHGFRTSLSVNSLNELT